MVDCIGLVDTEIEGIEGMKLQDSLFDCIDCIGLSIGLEDIVNHIVGQVVLRSSVVAHTVD